MNESLTDLLESAGPVDGGALLFDRGNPVDVTGFRAEVSRIAGGLAALGVGAGDTVAIWLPNIPAWLATFFALGRLGAIAVSVNTRYRSHELATVLRRSKARVLVYWPGFHGIDFAGILAETDPAALESLAWLVEYDEDGEQSLPPGKNSGLGIPRLAFAALAGASPGDRAPASAPCVLFTTSGTTREPKLVMHDQAHVVRHGRNVAAAWRLGPQSAVCQAPPLCGVYGFCTALAAIAARVPLWMRPVWDPAATAADIERGACTHMTGSDDVYAQLLNQRANEPRPFPSLAYTGFAAFNPALPDIVERAQERGLLLSGLYVTSEVMALFSLRVEDRRASDRGLAGGYPVDPSARVRARDPQTGEIAPHDTVGELEILAPQSRMCGYYGDAEATRAAFTDDGWYRTGDIGSTCSDGSFVYLARAGDSLRLGGYLVNPAEIEAVLAEADAVQACQVVGVQLPEGLRAVALVIPAEGHSIDEAALAAHMRGQVASYKVPIRYFAVDAFPVTASANGTKIRRDALRTLALQRLGAA